MTDGFAMFNSRAVSALQKIIAGIAVNGCGSADQDKPFKFVSDIDVAEQRMYFGLLVPRPLFASGIGSRRAGSGDRGGVFGFDKKLLPQR